MKKALVLLVSVITLSACTVQERNTPMINAPSPTVMTTIDQELNVTDILLGSGAATATGSAVTVHYTGKLADGTTFDSSLDRNQPFTFTVGAGNVIAGWEQGLLGMQVGGKRRLTIPPHLAYGAAGIPGVIPPQSTLIFEIELLSIE